MILTDEELQYKLKSPDNLINQLREVQAVSVVRIEKNHRGLGDRTIPPMVRALIAGVAASGTETQKEIADSFGVSSTTVSKTSRGLVNNRKDEGLTEVIGGTKERLESAHDLAVDALVNTLSSLNDKIHEVTKPSSLASIAEKMSRITNNLSGNSREVSEKTVKVILMSPVQKLETSYETIEV